MATTKTHTIKNAGGDYSTLIAWESAQQRNLVSADEIEVAEGYNDFGAYLTGYHRISGWTTDSTRYIKIYAPEGQRHDGTPETGFRLTNSASNCFYIQHANVHLEALEIKMTGAGHAISTNSAQAGWFIASHCLIHGNNSSSYNYMGFTSASLTFYFWNNFVYGLGRGLHLASGNPDVIIYNCSFFGCISYGVYANVAANAVLKNCAILDCPDDTYKTTYFHGDSDYNCGSDSDVSIYRVPGANSLHSKSGSDNFVNVGSGTEDLHIKDTGADIYGTGTDLDPDPDGNLNVTDDIDYVSRSEWSIGGDEVGVVTRTSTFTADAFIGVRTTNTFTADAIIKETKTDTFTADAIIEETKTDTFTADAIVKETKTDTFASDVWIATRYTDTFTGDARIVSRYTDTFTVDAIIDAEGFFFFTTDAVINDYSGDAELTVDVDTQVFIHESTAYGYEVVQQLRWYLHTWRPFNWAKQTKAISIIDDNAASRRYIKVGYDLVDDVDDTIEVVASETVTIPLRSEKAQVRTVTMPQQQQIGFFLPTKYR